MRCSAAAMAACALAACSGATPAPSEPVDEAAVLAAPKQVARPRLVVHHDSDDGWSLRLRRIRVWLDQELVYLRVVTPDGPPPQELLFDGHVLPGSHQLHVDMEFDLRRSGCMGGWFWSRSAVHLRSAHEFELSERSAGLGLCMITGDRGPFTAPFERRIGAWFEENALPMVCSTAFIDRPWLAAAR